MCLAPELSAQESGLASVAPTLSARTAAAPTLAAVLADEEPRIDGRLDEPGWARAAVANGFVQFRPNPGEAATERTDVRVLYTTDAVYVGARMHDSDAASIIRRLARRDQQTTTDEFTVGFDSYFDRRTAFAFAVSVAGVQRDWMIFSDTDEDSSWDAVWESATRRDDTGWTAELRIPLSQLRFAKPPEDGSGAIWGVNFQRHLAREGERSVWSPLPDDGSRMVSAFGTLRGLAGIRPSRSLEIRPYVLSSATRAPGVSENPFFNATDLHQAVGGDLKYGVTNNLTLNVTINPDFGQVEADPSVVNLSAFETFFPEKRPFFQEGADIFNFRLGGGDENTESLFYSRRIGRQPQGFVEETADYLDVPDATTIIGAAKLSGKTSTGWSLGFLNALTSSEHGRFQRPDGSLGDQLVEPRTNYAVARVIKDFRDGESAIGIIGTATNRGLDEDGPVSFLADAGYAGGLDFRHRFADGNYQVNGYFLTSLVRGNAGAIERVQESSRRYFQRPDADHVDLDPSRTSLFGTSASLDFLKVGGGHWRFGVFGQARSPGFEVNDIGFQTNADQAQASTWVNYQQFEPQGPFRRWGANLNAWSGWTFGGERIFTGGNVNGNFQLKNFWNGFFGFGQELHAHSTTALRGGPALYYPNGWFGWAGFNTDSRKPVRFGGFVNFGGEYGSETSRFSMGPNVTIQPSSQFELSMRPNVTWNERAWQYVGQPSSDTGTHYVFGRLDQQTVSLTTRLNYTVSPDLSIQLYAQPFVSAGTYDNLMEVADPRARAFSDRFALYDEDRIRRIESDGFGTYEIDEDGDGEADFSFSDPDFNIKSLRSNLVLRWQYRPGSTIFLVWSRDQGSFVNDGSFEFGRDFGDVFNIPSTNVLLLKFEHWLGL
ncbi:MAG: carbohydrate binding family 9 domain-containing protein [Gemmatimonadetes bacterium]|nr:carbohydrate binding family 9 domain-containing protein [Gemmatimonadota bacterium]